MEATKEGSATRKRSRRGEGGEDGEKEDAAIFSGRLRQDSGGYVAGGVYVGFGFVRVLIG